jgi:predicted TIM-barrel fold metal-dependent hydrolase
VRIWDLHCHLTAGASPEEGMDRLVECADRLGIERLIVFMGRPIVVDPSPEELRRQNDQVLRALARHPDRAFGFVYVSPKHVEASLAEIDRCVGDGPMVGLKLWVALRCNAPEIDPIIRAAVALDAVIFQHTWMKVGGNLPGESTPMDLAELAARHPDAKLICGHAGGDWERGLRAIRASSNVAAELAGSFPTAGLTEMAVRELGASRVIYGSDTPGRAFATQLGKVLGAAISEEDRRLILGENLRRLLGPILRSKGVRV